jgi:hypothetical protein
VAFNTPNKFRAIQFLTDGHVSFTVPDASRSGSADGFDSRDEFAVVVGIYPLADFPGGAGGAGTFGTILIMLPGNMVGGVPAIIIPEELVYQ